MRWRMTIVFLGGAITLSGWCHAQAAKPVWTAAGPGTVTGTALGGAAVAGPVDALVIAANGTVYAGGLGGVWRYLPVTDTWTAVSSGAPVAAVTIAGGNLYAGTGNILTPGEARAGTGILVSRDGGSHWTTLGADVFAGLAVTRVAVNPRNPAQLLAVAALPAGAPGGPSPGLYASGDAGATWSQLLTGEVRDVAWDGVSGEVLTAVSNSVNTVLDLSQTGQPPFLPLTLSSTPSGAVALRVAPGGGFLAFWTGTQPGLAAIGTDGAATMLPVPASVGSGETTGLAVNSDGTHIWAGAADLWVTSDRGQSWRDLSLGLPVGTQQHGIAWTSSGGVWTANDGGVWMAPAGGSLQNENAGLSNTAPVALAITASGAVAAWAGDSDGAGTGALAPQAAWNANGDEFFSFLGASGSTVDAALRDSATLVASRDGGHTWSAGDLAPAAITGVIRAVAVTTSALWLGTSTGELWVSGDQGATWGQRTPPAEAASGITALAAGGDELWLAAGAEVWSSADGGQSWVLAPNPGGSVVALAAPAAHAAEVAAVTAAGVELLQAGAWNALAATAAPITALAWDGSDTLWASTLGRGFWSLPLAEAGMQVTLTPAATNAVAGQSAAVSFTVRAIDLAGAAAGIPVTVSSSSGWSASATTDISGTAAVEFPIPTAAGAISVLASAQGAWGAGTASATVTVQPGALSQIKVVAGQGASALAGTVLDLTLECQDQYGNPVPGVTVALSGTGGFSPPTVTTSADGRANVAYTLPSVPGSVTLTATAGAVAATWQETALPQPSYTLLLTPPVTAVPPGQATAAVTVQVVPGAGGYSAPVAFQGCEPSPGCSFSTPSVSPPYPPITLSVDLAARTAAQSSVNVTVATDATHTVTVPIPLQGFTLASSAAALSVTAGQTSAPVMLTLTAVNGMAASVSFQAAAMDGSTLPAWLVPVFTPGSIAIPAVSTATFAVSAAQAAGSGYAGGDGRWLWVILLSAAGLGEGFRRGRHRGRRLALLTALAFSVAGCGGGGAAAPPAPAPPPSPAVSTYTLQLTATAGGLQAAVPVQVSVTTP